MSKKTWNHPAPHPDSCSCSWCNEIEDSPSLHPQNDRIGTAGLPITELLNSYRFPPVWVTVSGTTKHETPLCPHVKNRPHRMICRESALYAYGEEWCGTCRMHNIESGGWTDPRYRQDDDSDGELIPDGGQSGDPDTERTECWRCGYERLIFEACPECGVFGGDSA